VVCPHCGVEIPGVEARAKTATAVVMGLTLAGCMGETQPLYGVVDDGGDWTATSGSTTSDDSTTGSTTAMEGSATSDDSTSGSTDAGTSSTTGDTDTDTDTDTDGSTGDSSTTDETGTSVGEPEYGVPDTGDEPLYGVADAG
jgi:hypothetical protein